MAAQTVWFDVSTSMGYAQRRPTGIARVELQVARELARFEGVRFVRYDHRVERLVGVDPSELDRLFERLTSETDGTTSPDPTIGATRPAQVLRGGVDRLVASPKWRGAATALWNARDGARRVGVGLTQFVNEVGQLLADRRRRTEPCASTQWRHTDVLCSVGLWDVVETAAFFKSVTTDRPVRTVLTMYDLIPVLRPQFRAQQADRDRAVFRDVLSIPSVVIAISESTAADVADFCRAERLPVPACRVVPMASSVLDTAPVRPAAMHSVGEFVLCVGTIEIRKNHHLLFDVWESMIAESDGSPIPTLVIAGGLGWLNTETVQRMHSTPGFDRHVVFVEDPTDHELAWLYRNCVFTVYPSFYEGWGLPVTESLDAGKVCLTSNVSSMPEAAEGLGILLDPTDWRAWKAEIIGLLGDRERRYGLEAAIVAGHVVRTPADVASAVWSVLGEVRTAD